MLIFFNQLCPWMLCIRYKVGVYVNVKCETMQRKKHMHLICAIELTQKLIPGSPRISSPPGPISSEPCFYDHSIKICYHCSTINLLQVSFNIVRIDINLQLGLGDFGVRQKIEISSLDISVIFGMLICSPALWHRLVHSPKLFRAPGTFEALLFCS